MSDVDAFYLAVGKRIRIIRRKCNLTQEDLGRSVSLTRTSITNIERGRQKLLLHTLADIAKTLGVSCGELLPAAPTNADEQLDRALEKHSESERDFVISVVRSASTYSKKES